MFFLTTFKYWFKVNEVDKKLSYYIYPPIPAEKIKYTVRLFPIRLFY